MPTKSRTLWLLAAVAAPAAHFSGCGWLPALLAAAVLLPLPVLNSDWADLSRPHAMLQILWLGFVTGTVLKNAAAYWPSGNDLAVPLTLLALVFLAKSQGASRIGAVLSFCLLLLAVPLICSAAATMELGWLRPTLSRWPWGILLALMLAFLPVGEGRTGGAVFFLPVVLAIVTQGTIGPGAATLPDPFYQAGRTLGHTEPILAAAMTLAFYAVTSWMRSAAEGMLSGSLPRLLFAGMAVFAIWNPQVHLGGITVLISGFLWVLIPFLRAQFAAQKKVEKR